MQDLDENKIFQGLNPWQWVKLVFTTRASMLREHGRITDMLLSKNVEASEDRARAWRANGHLAQLVQTQHAALVQAERQLRDDDAYGEERIEAHRAVVAAIKAAEAPYEKA